MKLKSVFILALILIVLGSISAIYADTYIVGNSSFSLSDDYTMTEKGDETIFYNDKYVITFYEGAVINTTEAKNKRIDMGYTFLGDNDYEFDGAKINQQNYNHNGFNVCIYTLEKNNQSYLISLILFENQEIPEYRDNPVTEIIDTLETR